MFLLHIGKQLAMRIDILISAKTGEQPETVDNHGNNKVEYEKEGRYP